MKIRTTLAAAAALFVLVAAPAHAAKNTYEDMSFGDLMSEKMIDKNRDGMVSRTEFMDMMGKVWDMKAKEMNVKGGRMTPIEFNEILKYLHAGS